MRLLLPVLVLGPWLAAIAFARRSRAAFVFALAAIAFATLTPQRGANDVQVRPLAEIVAALHDLGEPANVAGLVGNVALFAPLGVALDAAGVSWLSAVAVGLGVSATVEAMQLLIPGRTSAVDDVLLNVVGTAVGFAAARRWPRGATPP